MKSRKPLFFGIAATFVIVAACLYLCFWKSGSGEASDEVLITLKELPGVSEGTLADQGTLFTISEPLLYNRATKMGVFVTKILSAKNFDDETHLIMGGDAQSLECFRHEVRLVNSGASRAAAAGGGAVDGVAALVDGLWHLVRHPVDSVKGLGSGIKNSANYVWETKMADMEADARRLANAFYCSKALEMAEAHHVDYFDLKTEHGREIIHSEVNAHLAGRGATELALLVVPFSEVKFGGKAAQTAKAAEAASVVEKLAETGRLPATAMEFAKAGRLFPDMVEKMLATLERLKSALPASRFKPRVVTLGEAVSADYKTTFFRAYPKVTTDVVVHHAVPQAVMKRYPGLITENQLHSLENLRGIPKGLNDTLHNSWIAKEWNEFYRLNEASSMTREKLLQKAAEIDDRFGHLFTPRLP